MFLKIGNYTINTDRINYLNRETPESLEVWLQDGGYLAFKGAKADAIEAFLSRQMTDLNIQTADDLSPELVALTKLADCAEEYVAGVVRVHAVVKAISNARAVVERATKGMPRPSGDEAG